MWFGVALPLLLCWVATHGNSEPECSPDGSSPAVGACRARPRTAGPELMQLKRSKIVSASVTDEAHEVGDVAHEASPTQKGSQFCQKVDVRVDKFGVLQSNGKQLRQTTRARSTRGKHHGYSSLLKDGRFHTYFLDGAQSVKRHSKGAITELRASEAAAQRHRSNRTLATRQGERAQPAVSVLQHGEEPIRRHPRSQLPEARPAQSANVLLDKSKRRDDDIVLFEQPDPSEGSIAGGTIITIPGRNLYDHNQHMTSGDTASSVKSPLMIYIGTMECELLVYTSRHDSVQCVTPYLGKDQQHLVGQWLPITITKLVDEGGAQKYVAATKEGDPQFRYSRAVTPELEAVTPQVVAPGDMITIRAWTCSGIVEVEPVETVSVYKKSNSTNSSNRTADAAHSNVLVEDPEDAWGHICEPYPPAVKANTPESEPATEAELELPGCPSILGDMGFHGWYWNPEQHLDDMPETFAVEDLLDYNNLKWFLDTLDPTMAVQWIQQEPYLAWGETYDMVFKQQISSSMYNSIGGPYVVDLVTHFKVLEEEDYSFFLNCYEACYIEVNGHVIGSGSNYLAGFGTASMYTDPVRLVYGWNKVRIVHMSLKRSEPESFIEVKMRAQIASAGAYVPIPLQTVRSGITYANVDNLNKESMKDLAGHKEATVIFEATSGGGGCPGGASQKLVEFKCVIHGDHEPGHFNVKFHDHTYGQSIEGKNAVWETGMGGTQASLRILPKITEVLQFPSGDILVKGAGLDHLDTVSPTYAGKVYTVHEATQDHLELKPTSDAISYELKAFGARGLQREVWFQDAWPAEMESKGIQARLSRASELRTVIEDEASAGFSERLTGVMVPPYGGQCRFVMQGTQEHDDQPANAAKLYFVEDPLPTEVAPSIVKVPEYTMADTTFSGLPQGAVDLREFQHTGSLPGGAFSVAATVTWTSLGPNMNMVDFGWPGHYSFRVGTGPHGEDLVVTIGGLSAVAPEALTENLAQSWLVTVTARGRLFVYRDGELVLDQILAPLKATDEPWQHLWVGRGQYGQSGSAFHGDIKGLRLYNAHLYWDDAFGHPPPAKDAATPTAARAADFLFGGGSYSGTGVDLRSYLADTSVATDSGAFSVAFKARFNDTEGNQPIMDFGTGSSGIDNIRVVSEGSAGLHFEVCKSGVCKSLLASQGSIGATLYDPQIPGFPTSTKTAHLGTSGSVMCDAGQVLLGGGCDVTSHNWLIDKSAPEGNNAWTCSGHSGTKKAWAICAPQAVNPTIKYGEGHDWHSVMCDEGQVLTGGGCHASDRYYIYSKSGPTEDGRGWECGGHGGHKKVWAICIDAAKAPTMKFEDAAQDWFELFCGAGQKVIGGGCQAYSGNYRFHYNAPGSHRSWRCGGHGGKKKVWAMCVPEQETLRQEHEYLFSVTARGRMSAYANGVPVGAKYDGATPARDAKRFTLMLADRFRGDLMDFRFFPDAVYWSQVFGQPAESLNPAPLEQIGFTPQLEPTLGFAAATLTLGQTQVVGELPGALAMSVRATMLLDPRVTLESTILDTGDLHISVEASTGRLTVSAKRGSGITVVQTKTFALRPGRFANWLFAITSTGQLRIMKDGVTLVEKLDGVFLSAEYRQPVVVGKAYATGNASFAGEVRDFGVYDKFVQWPQAFGNAVAALTPACNATHEEESCPSYCEWNVTNTASPCHDVFVPPPPPPEPMFAANPVWTMILKQHKDLRFNSKSASRFWFKPHSPHEKSWMKVGSMSPYDPQHFSSEGSYRFKLVYHGTSWSKTLVWSQSSWLTEDTVSGFAPESPAGEDEMGPSTVDEYYRFVGLSKEGPNTVFRGGNVHGSWWNAVGGLKHHHGGYPAWGTQIAQQMELYIMRDAFAPFVAASTDSGKIPQTIPYNTMVPGLEGSKVYTDRDYTFTSLGSYPADCVYIAAANDDRNTRWYKNQFTLSADVPYTVYLEFHASEGKGFANWKHGWKEESMASSIINDGEDSAATTVYSMNFGGQKARLFGNDGGGLNSYLVFVCPWHEGWAMPLRDHFLFSSFDDGRYYVPPETANVLQDGTTRYVLVSVQAKNDAHIGLFSAALEPMTSNPHTSNFYEIVIGGWGNSRSVIRKNGGEKTNFHSNPCDKSRFLDFWASVDTSTGRVAVGTGHDINAGVFMEWTDDSPYEILSFAYKTGWGSDGFWDSTVCDWGCYLENYDDLKDLFGGDHEAAAEHYATSGRFEQRDCRCVAEAQDSAGSSGEHLAFTEEPNYCVSDDDEEFESRIATGSSIGNVGRTACEAACLRDISCSGYEWIPNGYSGDRCFLALGVKAVTKGSSRKFPGAKCFIRPIIPPFSAPELVMNMRASNQEGDIVKDPVSGVEFGALTVSYWNDVPIWYIDYIQHSAGDAWYVGSQYTSCQWIWWRESDRGWRTLFRGDNDHMIIVRDGQKKLGMYSNRRNGWREMTPAYDIITTDWSFVCVVGVSSNSDQPYYGTSTFIVGEGTAAPQVMGTADRVSSGTKVYRIGWNGQGPGNLASMMHWNKALSLAEIDAVHKDSMPEQLKARQVPDSETPELEEWTVLYSKGDYGFIGYDKANFNRKFRLAGTGIVKRECSDCNDEYKEVYFRRKKGIEDFDAYENLLVTWMNDNHHIDFDIYTTLEDAIADTNAWYWCNGNNGGIGFAYDCGPTNRFRNNWFSLTRGGKNHVKFSVYYAGPQGIPPAPWRTLFAKGSYGDIETGSEAFNDMFRAADTGIIRRQCSGCTSTHFDVFYRRKTDLDTWDAYEDMLVTWSDTGFHEAFDIYSSLAEALNDENAWQQCNGDDPGIGFPRDCGPSGRKGNQWNSLTRDGQANYIFSVYMPQADPEEEVEETAMLQLSAKDGAKSKSHRASGYGKRSSSSKATITEKRRSRSAKKGIMVPEGGGAAEFVYPYQSVPVLEMDNAEEKVSRWFDLKEGKSYSFKLERHVGARTPDTGLDGWAKLGLECKSFATPETDMELLPMASQVSVIKLKEYPVEITAPAVMHDCTVGLMGNSQDVPSYTSTGLAVAKLFGPTCEETGGDDFIIADFEPSLDAPLRIVDSFCGIGAKVIKASANGVWDKEFITLMRHSYQLKDMKYLSMCYNIPKNAEVNMIVKSKVGPHNREQWFSIGMTLSRDQPGWQWHRDKAAQWILELDENQQTTGTWSCATIDLYNQIVNGWSEENRRFQDIDYNNNPGQHLNDMEIFEIMLGTPVHLNGRWQFLKGDVMIDNLVASSGPYSVRQTQPRPVPLPLPFSRIEAVANGGFQFFPTSRDRQSELKQVLDSITYECRAATFEGFEPGWNKVTKSMLVSTASHGELKTTITEDDSGGVQIHDWYDNGGCDKNPAAVHFISGPWTHVKYTQTWDTDRHNTASCWGIFGSDEYHPASLQNNLYDGDWEEDSIYDIHWMNDVQSSNLVSRCDNRHENFWRHARKGHHATVELRRRDFGAAGISTGASCVHWVGWSYTDIQVFVPPHSCSEPAELGDELDSCPEWCAVDDEGCTDLIPEVPPPEEGVRNFPVTLPNGMPMYDVRAVLSPITGEWSEAVALDGCGCKQNSVRKDIGEAEFNSIFARCPAVRYRRHGAVHSVYVRKTPPPADFNAYEMFTGFWSMQGNELHHDMEIYSSEEEARRMSGAWGYCSHGQPGIGFPGECGAEGAVKSQWFAMPSFDGPAGLQHGAVLDLYEGSNCPSPWNDGVTTGTTTPVAHFSMEDDAATISAVLSGLVGSPVHAQVIAKENEVWPDMSSMWVAQSSEAHNGVPSRAVDGNANADWNGGSCIHTNYDQDPWWEVTLDKPSFITSVRVTSRKDHGNQMDGFTIFVDGVPCAEDVGIGHGETRTISCIAAGQTVRVQRVNRYDVLVFCELAVGIQEETSHAQVEFDESADESTAVPIVTHTRKEYSLQVTHEAGGPQRELILSASAGESVQNFYVSTGMRYWSKVTDYWFQMPFSTEQLLPTHWQDHICAATGGCTPKPATEDEGVAQLSLLSLRHAHTAHKGKVYGRRHPQRRWRLPRRYHTAESLELLRRRVMGTHHMPQGWDATAALLQAHRGKQKRFSKGHGTAGLDPREDPNALPWSDPASWGGEDPPTGITTDIVFIPEGITGILDMNLAGKKSIKFWVIEGNLVVHNTMNLEVEAEAMIVNGGQFLIGSETSPYLGHAVITLAGHWHSFALPLCGSKTIFQTMGNIEMWGRPVPTTWTELAETANPYSRKLHLIDSVDWKPGDMIVIATSDRANVDCRSDRRDYCQVEERYVQRLENGGKTIIIDRGLAYRHVSEELDPRFPPEYCAANPGLCETTKVRAEVGLLTRNIYVRGSNFYDGSGPAGSEGFGAHVMMAERGLFNYVEFHWMGQQFQMGRYPLHYHLTGLNPESKVIGCSLHNTFQRGITVHGSHRVLIKDVVLYNHLSHGFFIEDGNEHDNVYEHNLGMLTHKSFSMLVSDQTPATFWIRNQANYFRNNHAAGGATFGFWFDSHAMAAPLEMKEFTGNVAHSNGNTGVWVDFSDPHKDCLAPDDWTVGVPFEDSSFVSKPVHNNAPECTGPRTTFDMMSTTTWGNVGTGITFFEGGHLSFINHRSVSDGAQGLFVWGVVGDDWPDETNGWNGPTIRNSAYHNVFPQMWPEIPFAPPNKPPCNIGLPWDDTLFITGVQFIGPVRDGHFCSCVGCLATEGGYQHRTSKLSWHDGAGTVDSKRASWPWAMSSYFFDLDGTLTELTDGCMTSGCYLISSFAGHNAGEYQRPDEDPAPTPAPTPLQFGFGPPPMGSMEGLGLAQTADCLNDLVGRSGDQVISDEKITASSAWSNDPGHGYNNMKLSRLDTQGTCWCAGRNNAEQWIQWEFDMPLRVTSIQTQGRQNYDQWVSKYTISFSMDGTTWNNLAGEFDGNWDRNSIKENAVTPFIAQYVRLHPKTWRSHISMRANVLGCPSDTHDAFCTDKEFLDPRYRNCRDIERTYNNDKEAMKNGFCAKEGAYAMYTPLSANQACCACGGGQTVYLPKLPTDGVAPAPVPAPAPQARPKIYPGGLAHLPPKHCHHVDATGGIVCSRASRMQLVTIKNAGLWVDEDIHVQSDHGYASMIFQACYKEYNAMVFQDGRFMFVPPYSPKKLEDWDVFEAAITLRQGDKFVLQWETVHNPDGYNVAMLGQVKNALVNEAPFSYTDAGFFHNETYLSELEKDNDPNSIAYFNEKLHECMAKSGSDEDDGFNDVYRGWFDVQGCGKCFDYCRWVGRGHSMDPTQQMVNGDAWWSCRLAGGWETYTPEGYFSSWPYLKCDGEGADALPAEMHPIIVGSSDNQQKCVWADTPVLCEPDVASEAKRLNAERGGEFEVHMEGKNVCVKRVDADDGWSFALHVACNKTQLKLDIGLDLYKKAHLPLLDMAHEENSAATWGYIPANDSYIVSEWHPGAFQVLVSGEGLVFSSNSVGPWNGYRAHVKEQMPTRPFNEREEAAIFEHSHIATPLSWSRWDYAEAPPANRPSAPENIPRCQYLTEYCSMNKNAFGHFGDDTSAAMAACLNTTVQPIRRFKWSEWPEDLGGKPVLLHEALGQGYGNITIREDWEVTLDEDVDFINKLNISGVLKFEDKPGCCKLVARFIVVGPFFGKLQAGTAEQPFSQGKAHIVLKGHPLTPPVENWFPHLMGSAKWMQSKFLAVQGQLHLYGKTRSKLWAPLAQSTERGASSLRLAGGDFKVGDTITLHNGLETPRVVSVGSDGDEVILGVDPPLQNLYRGLDYMHLGKEETAGLMAHYVGLVGGDAFSVVVQGEDTPGTPMCHLNETHRCPYSSNNGGFPSGYNLHDYQNEVRYYEASTGNANHPNCRPCLAVSDSHFPGYTMAMSHFHLHRDKCPKDHGEIKVSGVGFDHGAQMSLFHEYDGDNFPYNVIFDLKGAWSKRPHTWWSDPLWNELELPGKIPTPEHLIVKSAFNHTICGAAFALSDAGVTPFAVAPVEENVFLKGGVGLNGAARHKDGIAPMVLDKQGPMNDNADSLTHGVGNNVDELTTRSTAKVGRSWVDYSFNRNFLSGAPLTMYLTSKARDNVLVGEHRLAGWIVDAPEDELYFKNNILSNPGGRCAQMMIAGAGFGFSDAVLFDCELALGFCQAGGGGVGGKITRVTILSSNVGIHYYTHGPNPQSHDDRKVSLTVSDVKIYSKAGGGGIAMTNPKVTSSAIGDSIAPDWWHGFSGRHPVANSAPPIAFHTDLDHVTFVGFDKDAGGVAIAWGERAQGEVTENDHYPIIARAVSFIDMAPDAYMRMNRPGSVGEDTKQCIQMNCDSRRNSLLIDEDGSFLGTAGTIVAFPWDFYDKLAYADPSGFDTMEDLIPFPARYDYRGDAIPFPTGVDHGTGGGLRFRCTRSVGCDVVFMDRGYWVPKETLRLPSGSNIVAVREDGGLIELDALAHGWAYAMGWVPTNQTEMTEHWEDSAKPESQHARRYGRVGPGELGQHPNASKVAKTAGPVYTTPGIYRDGCTYNDAWRSYACPGAHHRTLVVEVMDWNHRERRWAPVSVEVNDQYKQQGGTLNILGGPPMMWPGDRLQTFHTVGHLGLRHNIYFSADPPQHLRFHLLNTDPEEGIVICVYYGVPNSIVGYVDGLSKEPLEGATPQWDNYVFHHLDPAVHEHGTYFYDRVGVETGRPGYLYAVVKGGKSVDFKISHKVELSTKVEVDASWGGWEDETTGAHFYDQGMDGLTQNIALLIGCPPSRISIMGEGTAEEGTFWNEETTSEEFAEWMWEQNESMAYMDLEDRETAPGADVHVMPETSTDNDTRGASTGGEEMLMLQRGSRMLSSHNNFLQAFAEERRAKIAAALAPKGWKHHLLLLASTEQSLVLKRRAMLELHQRGKAESKKLRARQTLLERRRRKRSSSDTHVTYRVVVDDEIRSCLNCECNPDESLDCAARADNGINTAEIETEESASTLLSSCDSNEDGTGCNINMSSTGVDAHTEVSEFEIESVRTDVVPRMNAEQGWFCDPEWYADGQTCDCDCGIWDPDCEQHNKEFVSALWSEGTFQLLDEEQVSVVMNWLDDDGNGNGVLDGAEITRISIFGQSALYSLASAIIDAQERGNNVKGYKRLGHYARLQAAQSLLFANASCHGLMAQPPLPPDLAMYAPMCVKDTEFELLVGKPTGKCALLPIMQVGSQCMVPGGGMQYGEQPVTVSNSSNSSESSNATELVMSPSAEAVCGIASRTFSSGQGVGGLSTAGVGVSTAKVTNPGGWYMPGTSERFVDLTQKARAAFKTNPFEFGFSLYIRVKFQKVPWHAHIFSAGRVWDDSHIAIYSDCENWHGCNHGVSAGGLRFHRQEDPGRRRRGVHDENLHIQSSALRLDIVEETPMLFVFDMGYMKVFRRGNLVASMETRKSFKGLNAEDFLLYVGQSIPGHHHSSGAGFEGELKDIRIWDYSVSWDEAIAGTPEDQIPVPGTAEAESELSSSCVASKLNTWDFVCEEELPPELAETFGYETKEQVDEDAVQQFQEKQDRGDVTVCGAITGVKGVIFHGTFGDGLTGEYFRLRQDGRPPFLFGVVPDQIVIDPVIDFKGDFRAPYNEYAIRWSGKILIEAGGDYLFTIVSDDGSWVALDGRMFIDNGGTRCYGTCTQSNPGSKAASMYLEKGPHTLSILYFNRGPEDAQGSGSAPKGSCRLSYSGPDTKDLEIIVPQEVLGSAPMRLSNLNRTIEEVETEDTIEATPSWKVLYGVGDYGNFENDKATFNSRFRAESSGIARRECSGCRDSHKDVYYKRKAAPAAFDAWEGLMVTWRGDVGMHDEWDIYSTLEDALNDTNPWQVCNGNYREIGFPRDCGPTGWVWSQWNSLTRGGQRSYKWSVYHIPEAGEVAETPEPTGSFEWDEQRHYGIMPTGSCDIKCRQGQRKGGGANFRFFCDRQVDVSFKVVVGGNGSALGAYWIDDKPLVSWTLLSERSMSLLSSMPSGRPQAAATSGRRLGSKKESMLLLSMGVGSGEYIPTHESTESATTTVGSGMHSFLFQGSPADDEIFVLESARFVKGFEDCEFFLEGSDKTSADC